MDELVEIGEVAFKSGSGLEKLAAPIGSSVPRAFAALLRLGAPSSAAVARFEAACERLLVSTDPRTVAGFRTEAAALEQLAVNLNARERRSLLSEIAQRNAVLEVQLADETAAAGAGSKAITRPKPGTTAFGIARRATASKIQRTFAARIRAAATVAKTEAETLVADAIERLVSTIGPAQTEGWDGVFDYLASNLNGIAKAEKRVASASEALASGVAGAEEELAAAAKSRSGYHSAIKGLLGEAFAARCDEWKVLREAFQDLARRRADTLNALARKAGSSTRWEVVTVRGSASIDGLDAWDEAILVVEKLRPGMTMPRAELLMSAQYKVERRVKALKQIWRDVWREKGKDAPAIFSHTLEGGGQPSYMLVPASASRRPTRFLFNAEGGQLPAEDLATFAEGHIQAQQGVLTASVDQFNAATDELLSSATASTQPPVP